MSAYSSAINKLLRDSAPSGTYQRAVWIPLRSFVSFGPLFFPPSPLFSSLSLLLSLRPFSAVACWFPSRSRGLCGLTGLAVEFACLHSLIGCGFDFRVINVVLYSITRITIILSEITGTRWWTDRHKLWACLSICVCFCLGNSLCFFVWMCVLENDLSSAMLSATFPIT